MTTKYIVMSHDRKTGETFVNREFATMEEAERYKNELYEWCDLVWCEDHKNWIEER